MLVCVSVLHTFVCAIVPRATTRRLLEFPQIRDLSSSPHTDLMVNRVDCGLTGARNLSITQATSRDACACVYQPNHICDVPICTGSVCLETMLNGDKVAHDRRVRQSCGQCAREHVFDSGFGEIRTIKTTTATAHTHIQVCVRLRNFNKGMPPTITHHPTTDIMYIHTFYIHT